MTCDNDWPCVRDTAHDQPRGCVHESAWLADRHDDETGDEQ